VREDGGVVEPPVEQRDEVARSGEEASRTTRPCSCVALGGGDEADGELASSRSGESLDLCAHQSLRTERWVSGLQELSR